MKIYVTRHGQVELKTEYYDGNPMLPKGEILLSEMGKQQATLLGKRLKKLGFSGKIFASPFLRTMETAELISKETGAKIVPTPWMHEIFGDQVTVNTYRGYSIEELRRYYFGIEKDAELEYPWWATEAETPQMVRQRVVKGLEKCMSDITEDILLVGHGASSRAAHEYLNLKKGGFIWNCALGMYDTECPENNYGNDISHLPEQMVTSNKVRGIDLDFDSDFEEIYAIDMPKKLREEKGTKLLHIGDAHSESYMYYKQLISTVKPDIIVYTGDTADEVKVGGYPKLKDEYLAKAQVLIDIFKKSGCKIYWVPGNNDMPDEIARMAPFMEIIEPGTVLDFEGVKLSLSHSQSQITKTAEIYLYGHSRMADSFDEEISMLGNGTMCLNALWSSHVYVLPKKELHIFNFPWK